MLKIIVLIVAFVLEIKNIFLSTDHNNYLEKHLCYISSKNMECLIKNNKCSDNYKCKSGYFRCGLKYCATNKLSCRLFLFNEHNSSIINLNLIPNCSIDLTTAVSPISLTNIDLKTNLCVISKTNCFILTKISSSRQCYNNDYKCKKKGYFKCGQNHCAKHKITCRLFLMNKNNLTLKLKQQISTCLIIDSYIFSDESIIISINPKYYLFIFIFILFLFLYFADLSTNF